MIPQGCNTAVRAKKPGAFRPPQTEAQTCPVQCSITGHPPPRLAWAAHKAPHCLPRGCLPLVDDDLSLLRIQTLEQSFIDVLQC